MAPHLWTTILLGLTLGLGIASHVTPWAGQDIPAGEQCVQFAGCFDVPGSDLRYHAWEIQVSSDGQRDSIDWTDDNLYGQDGVAEMRAVGPLLVVGVVLAAAAIPLIWVGWFRHVGFSIAGIIGTGLAAAFILVAGILAWVGLADLAADIEQSGGEQAFPHVGGFLALLAFITAGSALAAAIVDTLRGRPLQSARLQSRPDAAVIQLACPQCDALFSARAGGIARCPQCRFQAPTPV